MATLTVYPKNGMALKEGLAESGWFQEEVLAAGQLRQGRAPSTLGMVTGAALVEVIRPRRSKLLPRHFALVVTPSEVLAYKASGGSGEASSVYTMRIKDNVEARFPRTDVRITELEEGEKSKGGMLIVGGESIPVARPNLNGDASTDELLALLSQGS